MFYDSIQLLEGSKFTNVVVDSGASFPQSPTEGELFYRTDDDTLYAYNGSAWITTAGQDLALPTQTGNSGKYLTTDGSAASWSTVNVNSLDSATVATSLSTSSTSFDLINSTATTINFAGAASSLSIGASSGTTTVNNNLKVTGNLTVDGTTTTVNSTTVNVDDKNIELGSVASPSNTTADGGGITLKGATDKTFNWVNATSAWTSSEHLNLSGGKSYHIGGTAVLSATTLGSGVTASSLTSVGTLTSVSTSGTVTVNEIGEFMAKTLVTSTTAIDQVVDSAPIATYRAVKYVITIRSGEAHQLTEVYLMHDGSVVYISEIGTMKTAGNLASFSGDISSGDMVLKVSPVNAVTTIKLMRTALKV